MSEKELVLFEDIIESIDKIVEYTENIDFDAFATDTMRVDAVVRNLEVIGEAAKAVSLETKAELPEIDWKGMAGMRDRLIHAYRTVDDFLVWKTAKDRLAPIKNKLLEKYHSLTQQK
jgi:uncharacterized protein with HEPN domain